MLERSRAGAVRGKDGCKGGVGIRLWLLRVLVELRVSGGLNGGEGGVV